MAMARWNPAQCASRCSGGTMRSSDRPTASAARWPSRRSAPALHDVMTPSVSATTMPVRAVAVIPMAPSSTRGARPILYEWERIVEPIVPDTVPSDARPPRRHRHRRQPRHRRGHGRRAGDRRRRRPRHVPAAPAVADPGRTGRVRPPAGGRRRRRARRHRSAARPGRRRRGRPHRGRRRRPPLRRGRAQLGPVSILVNNASGWVADTFTPDAVDRLGRRSPASRRRRSTATSASTPGPAPCSWPSSPAATSPVARRGDASSG